MKPTTRLRILEFLRRQHAAAAIELSAALGLTRANIRHHLVVLENNSLVEVIGQRRLGKGRPENIYGLSRRVLGDALDELSSALLDELLGNHSDEVNREILHSLAGRIRKGFPPVRSGPLHTRLADLVHGLNDLHYQAHWEASQVGARLVLGHCPYQAIINRYPDLCTVDRQILAGYLERDVEQTGKLERSIQGLSQCIFMVL